MITVPANALVQPVNERMPAILLPEAERGWLLENAEDVQTFQKMLVPYPSEQMEMEAVGRRPRQNNPQLPLWPSS